MTTILIMMVCRGRATSINSFLTYIATFNHVLTKRSLRIVRKIVDNVFGIRRQMMGIDAIHLHLGTWLVDTKIE
jgi:hypothetical protein